jgi:hypothetical protein
MRHGDTELRFGQEGTGVLLVDLGNVDHGRVIFCNPKAAEILQYDYFSLANQWLSALLPPPYSDVHKGCIQRFITVGNSMFIHHPQVLPLLTAQGSLVEVNLKVAFTCLGGTVLLLLGFRKVRTNREVALMTSEGVITATSQDFASLLGETSISTAGKLLSDLCPSLISSRDKEKSVQVRRSPPLYGRLVSEKYGEKTVHLAVLYSPTLHSSIAKPVEEMSQKEPTAPTPFSKSSWFTGHWPGKRYQTGRDLLIGM